MNKQAPIFAHQATAVAEIRYPYQESLVMVSSVVAPEVLPAT